MALKTVIKLALARLEGISIREFRVGIFVCITIAALNSLVLAFRIGYLEGYAAGSLPMHRDYSYDFMRMKIDLALLIIAIALPFRRVVGFLVSLLAAISIGIQYILWYLDTQRWLREVQVSDFSQLPVPSEFPNFAGLYLATPWDVIVLVIVTALFAWQVRVLITLVTSTRQHKRPT